MFYVTFTNISNFLKIIHYKFSYNYNLLFMYENVSCNHVIDILIYIISIFLYNL